MNNTVNFKGWRFEALPLPLCRRFAGEKKIDLYLIEIISKLVYLFIFYTFLEDPKSIARFPTLSFKRS